MCVSYMWRYRTEQNALNVRTHYKWNIHFLTYFRNFLQVLLKRDFRVYFLESSGDTPWIGLLVFVVERFYLLLFLRFAQFGRVGELEEPRRVLDQPLGVNGGHLSHVFTGCQHQFMIHNPAKNRKLTFSDRMIYYYFRSLHTLGPVSYPILTPH